jgi:Aspartate decarboxylase
MFRKFLRSKIHRATVTQADLHYEGSLTLPPDLLLASGIAPFEAVAVWNVTRGTRLETYAILGEEGSNEVCITRSYQMCCGAVDADRKREPIFGSQNLRSFSLMPTIVSRTPVEKSRDLAAEGPTILRPNLAVEGFPSRYSLTHFVDC